MKLLQQAFDEMIDSVTWGGKRKIIAVRKMHNYCFVIEMDVPRGDKYKISLTKGVEQVTLDES